MFSKGPPDDYREAGYFDCSGYTAPVLDTIWAALNGLGALNAATTDDSTWMQQKQSYDRSTVVGVGLMWLVMSGAAAAYGYHNASACADAEEEMRGEQRFFYRPSRRLRHVPAKPPAPPTPTAPPVAPVPSETAKPESTKTPSTEEASPFEK